MKDGGRGSSWQAIVEFSLLAAVHVPPEPVQGLFQGSGPAQVLSVDL